MNRIRFRWSATALATAMGMAGAPAAIAQDGMGRLFFTAAQRAQLDNARRQNVRAPIQGEQPAEEAQPLPQEVRLNGMLRRSDGRTTVWLNNKMVAPDAAVVPGTVEARARGNGGVTLSLPQSGRSVDLKVGQSVEALSGQIAEVYQRRTLATPPPDAKPAPEGALPAKPAAGPPGPVQPGSVEKVTPTSAGGPQTAAKATETVEPKRKRDDGPPWDLLQSPAK